MKINSKKIMIWVVAIASVIILPDVSMYYERYKLNSEKLPDTYKTYTELDSLKDAYYEVLKIDGGFIEPVIQASDSTIVIISGHRTEGKKGDTVENNWSKINLEGQIVDVLRYTNIGPLHPDYQTFNDYIVDVANNTYNTWIKNNDTVNYPIKNIADNKKFSKEEAKQIISGKVYMTQKYLNPQSDDEEAMVKLMIYKDNTWNYLLTDKSWIESPAYFIYKPKNSAYLLLNDSQNWVYYLIRPKSPFSHQ